MNAPTKPRISWTGVQWMCRSERTAPGHVWARWRTGFGRTPAEAHAHWLESPP